MKFHSAKNPAFLWLLALMLNALSVSIFAEIPKVSAEEMVYCPLTKKLQPVKAPKKTARRNPLAEICADGDEKRSFLDELSNPENAFRTAALDDRQFEQLVFDFFQKGRAAFDKLPAAPGFPARDSVKTFSTTAAPNGSDETRFVFKKQSENFAFAQQPRPPDAAPARFFAAPAFPESPNISRRIAPRAPPFSV